MMPAAMLWGICSSVSTWLNISALKMMNISMIDIRAASSSTCLVSRWKTLSGMLTTDFQPLRITAWDTPSPSFSQGSSFSRPMPR